MFQSPLSLIISKALTDAKHVALGIKHKFIPTSPPPREVMQYFYGKTPLKVTPYGTCNTCAYDPVLHEDSECRVYDQQGNEIGDCYSLVKCGSFSTVSGEPLVMDKSILRITATTQPNQQGT